MLQQGSKKQVNLFNDVLGPGIDLEMAKEKIQ